MKVTAINIRKYEKNTLQAFFDLKMDGLMTIIGCTLHRKNESYWIGLPAKQYTDKDGATKWQAIVEIPSERLQSLRDLIIDDLRNELGCAKDASEQPTAGYEPVAKHRQYGSTNKPQKASPEPSGWAIPSEAGDLAGIGEADDSIPF